MLTPEQSQEVRNKVWLADQAMAQRDHELFCERIWEATAYAIKCVANERGQRYQEHQHRRHVMRQIIVELDDPVLVEDYKDANRLHVHFYPSNLTDVQVRDATDTTRGLIDRLLPLTA